MVTATVSAVQCSFENVYKLYGLYSGDFRWLDEAYKY